MTAIFEFLEVILDVLRLVAPEEMASKVNEIDTSNSTKKIWIILFTVLYVIVILGLGLSLSLISDIIYRVVAGVLIVFFMYCLFKFYYLILNDKRNNA